MGEKGVGKSEKSLHYKRSTFFKVITEFMAQKDNFTAVNNIGGGSIYDMEFADENF